MMKAQGVDLPPWCANQRPRFWSEVLASGINSLVLSGSSKARRQLPSHNPSFP